MPLNCNVAEGMQLRAGASRESLNLVHEVELDAVSCLGRQPERQRRLHCSPPQGLVQRVVVFGVHLGIDAVLLRAGTGASAAQDCGDTM